MKTQAEKLAAVKKSCRMAKNVSRIMMILTIIGAILCLVGSGTVMIFKDTVNEIFQQGQAALSVTNPEMHGILDIVIDLKALIQAGEYAMACEIACIFGAVICLCAASIFAIITKTFSYLEKSETPFTEEIMKSLRRMFVVLTVVIGLTVGLGLAVVTGICLWCVYTIMDYGCVLQQEVDDTI